MYMWCVGVSKNIILPFLIFRIEGGKRIFHGGEINITGKRRFVKLVERVSERGVGWDREW